MAQEHSGKGDTARLGAVIRQARLDANMSQTALAEATGVEQTKLSRWELAKSTPSVVDVANLEFALLLRPGDILIRAGFVEMPPLDTERAIQADPILRDEERSILLRFYKTAVLMAAVEATTRGRTSRRRRRKT
jgi:transcriptional regulator with XRE-family HTH domain